MVMEYADNIVYLINWQIHIQFASRSLSSSSFLYMEFNLYQSVSRFISHSGTAYHCSSLYCLCILIQFSCILSFLPGFK
ncbi:hypothetical protein BRARA_B02319 [Brassica rapa]|uniref:Uncharacterized protein n=1 Tax=Brassica campestris TaxID=3711 RepID=A0A398AJ56_BRACM|nr:hypothetical protein BRARA_B02319 [Brassica rapa]